MKEEGECVLSGFGKQSGDGETKREAGAEVPHHVAELYRRI